MIEIRIATPSDKEILVEALFQMLIETDKDQFPSDVLPTKANAEVLYAMSVESAVGHGDPVLIAYDGSDICGAIAVCIRRGGLELKRKCAFGCGLFIWPKYRNFGITRKFMKIVDAMLRIAGVSVWEEAIFCGNVFPQAAVNAHGFTHSMRVYRKLLQP